MGPTVGLAFSEMKRYKKGFKKMSGQDTFFNTFTLSIVIMREIFIFILRLDYPSKPPPGPARGSGASLFPEPSQGSC